MTAYPVRRLPFTPFLRARCPTAARRLALAWLLILSTLASQAMAQSAVRVLRTAERVDPGSATIRAVSLPDRVRSSTGDDAAIVQARYRLQVDLGPAPRDQALYLSGLIAHARITVNGQVLVDGLGEAGEPLPRSLRRIRWLRVPDAFWRTGRNEIEIAAAGRGGFSVSPLQIGPASLLERRHDERVLEVVVGPALVATTMVCLALCVLVLWARRPGETLYGYFGVGALGWGLHSAWSVLPVSPLPQPHLVVWWTSLYAGFVALLVIFCVRFAGWRWPRFDRTLWTLALLAPATLYVADAAGAQDGASEAVRLGCIAAVAVGLVAVSVHGWRQRDIGSALLLAAGAVSFVFGVRDWQIAYAGLDNNPVYLTPYAGLLFIALVAWMLIDGFVQAGRALEQLNAELEERALQRSTELRLALDQMREAKDKAEAANRAKSRFLAAASHDLRQPVHALGLYLASIAGTSAAAPLQDTLARMAGSLASLGSMFDALLDISRMDAGVVVARAVAFEPDVLLRRLGDEFAPQAEAKGLRLALRGPPPSTARSAWADPLLTERIVRNLLANAVQCTTSGGVPLSWRLRPGPPARWWIQVWDTGRGIAEAEQARVFEEFYQVGRDARDSVEGLGLGLAIVRRLSQLMGVTVSLRSRPGHGSCFSLDLPAARQPPRIEPALPPVPLAPGHWVAVVEDEATVREGMRALLTDWRCRVVDGATAPDLLSAWRASGSPPVAAVIADLGLPDGSDGLQAIAALRAAWGDGSTPALVVTGDSSPEQIERLTRRGEPWLVKPVPAARLRGWLASALQGTPSDTPSGGMP